MRSYSMPSKKSYPALLKTVTIQLEASGLEAFACDSDPPYVVEHVMSDAGHLDCNCVFRR